MQNCFLYTTIYESLNHSDYTSSSKIYNLNGKLSKGAPLPIQLVDSIKFPSRCNVCNKVSACAWVDCDNRKPISTAASTAASSPKDIILELFTMAALAAASAAVAASVAADSIELVQLPVEAALTVAPNRLRVDDNEAAVVLLLLLLLLLGLIEGGGILLLILLPILLLLLL